MRNTVVMLAKKTDALKSWLIAITILLSLSSAAIALADAQVEELSTEQKIANKNQALTTTAIFFLGLAIMVNAYYAAKRAEAIQNSAIATEKNNEISLKNLQLTQEQLIAERLMRAITQLGHEDVATRTGAIYILEKVAQDSPQEYWTIMEIISAFVREKAGIREELAKMPKISTDIQAAMTVIGRRNVERDRENQKLDLRNTAIRQADLTNAKLQRLDLRGVDLTRAQLQGCDLFESNLENAKLCGTILYEANLRSCNLQAAKLIGANLNRANLSEANLRSADLSGASLRAANLRRANFYKANLQGANLKVADLSKAKLFLANLQGAKLGKAKLQMTGLIGANLKGANLNGTDLQQANLNAAKLQQTEIFFANLGKASLREADLLGANLMGANLQQAIFHEANLCGTNLMGANFFSTTLDNVKLQGANLTGAKNLRSQQIQFAVGDRTTVLPEDIEVPANWMRSQHSQTSVMEPET